MRATHGKADAMMLQAEEWKIERRRRACSGCGRPFRSEEELFSGILEAEGRFQRRDFCRECWGARPELFSFWKTRMPRLRERRLEDLAALTEFFKKLLASPSEDPARRKIAVLTALLLARKRRLRIVGSAPGRLRIEKSWDGEIAEIPDPPISDAEVEILRKQMEEIFDLEIGRGELAR